MASKVKTILYLIATFSFLIFPKKVLAHVLKTDGNIGIVFHTDPDDDPIAGGQTGLFFDLKDTSGKFKPENCSCAVSITENNKVIFNQPIFQNIDKNNPNNTSIFFVFPKKDDYQVKVSGNPNTQGLFQPFNLIYDVRVDRDNSQPNKSLNFIPYIAGSIVLLVVIIFIIKVI